MDMNSMFYNAGKTDGQFFSATLHLCSEKEKEEKLVEYCTGFCEAALKCPVETAFQTVETLVGTGATGGRNNKKPDWFLAAKKSFNNKWEYAVKKARGSSAGASAPKGDKAKCYSAIAGGIKGLRTLKEDDKKIMAFIMKALAK